MRRIAGVICAAAGAAAILLAAQRPAFAAAGQPQILAKSPEASVLQAVSDWELWDEEPVVPYYDADNYCWQQVWTAHGWRWLDVCYGQAF
jgi:hypothetical protein